MFNMECMRERGQGPMLVNLRSGRQGLVNSHKDEGRGINLPFLVCIASIRASGIERGGYGQKLERTRKPRSS